MKRLILFLVMILVILLAACQEEEAAKEEQKRIVPVETVEVSQGDFIIERSIYGRATPERVSPVPLPSPGEVKELHVTNGDKVKKGERLAVVSTAQGNIPMNAPSDGQVANLSTKEGSYVSNEEPLAMITNTEKMLLLFSVTANERELFKLNKKYTVLVNDKEIEATIQMIDTMPGENGLYPVEAVVDNEDADILSGMVIEMIVPEKTLESVLFVPTEAVHQEGNQTFVYIVKDGKAEKKEITIEETGSDTTAIQGDVVKGDEVVTSGQLTLTDGDQVEVERGEKI